MPNVKVIERRPFDINMTMQWNDIQELLTRCQRMWACAENDDDFQAIEYMERVLHKLADNIRTRLDKS